jgi:hypothetical protein
MKSHRKWQAGGGLSFLPWVIIVGLLIAATIFWLTTQTKEISQPPEPSIEVPVEATLPPEASFVEPPTPQLKPPDEFPKELLGYILESVKKESLVEGVKSYSVARYVAGDGSEISLRVLTLDPATSEKFTNHMLRALVSGGTVKSAGSVQPPENSGWTASQLFSREDAGIYVATNPGTLIMVSAPTPDIAKSFGSALKTKP